MLVANNHNFIRLWMFEQPRMASWTSDSIEITPLPFLRTGPGKANDGNPKFDLATYNTEYFDRLRQRVIRAREQGIYVSIMLFQGWCLDSTGFGVGEPFPFLPYHGDINFNTVSIPRTNDDFDDKPRLHSLKVSSRMLAIQRAYVKKVIETVNDLDNVLYEIINEGGATDWQFSMINYIKKTEDLLPHQHPVGMTHRGDKLQRNTDLMLSPADWISPNATPVEWRQGDSTRTSSFKFDPPDLQGQKVVLNDTDHLWGHGGNYRWVWKSFLRGLNPIFMDPWNPLPGKKDEGRTAGWFYDEGGILKDDPDYPDYAPLRVNMGYTRRYAEQIDLAHMVPHGELSSTGYCLANPGQEYLIYFSEGSGVVNLDGVGGEYSIEWFIPLLNKTASSTRTLRGGQSHTLSPPTILDAVLYLKRVATNEGR
jgi:hypothetical protein